MTTTAAHEIEKQTPSQGLVRFVSRLKTPVLAPMLANRRLSAAFALLGAIQVAAGTFHFHTFECPMLFATGVPCPGCGASRACGALFHGDWHSYVQLHLFAPLFLMATGMFALAAILPVARRCAFCAFVAALERRTGFTSALLTLMLIYWLVRLPSASHVFSQF